MARDGMKAAAGDLLLCVGFLTRLPVSGPPDRRLAKALWAAPLAGVLVGAAGAAAFGVAAALGLPNAICSAAAIAATMLFTGCLHEDGLADVADGFGGGFSRERKLEIMRDSRIGTFGVVALILSILVRWAALGAAPSAASVFFWMIAAHAASRALMPAFMVLVAPARTDGLSAGAGAPAGRTAGAAVALGICALLLLGPLAAVFAMVLLVLWFGLLKALTERQIGGQTGDVLGALQQGGEIAVLLAALSVHG